LGSQQPRTSPGPAEVLRSAAKRIGVGRWIRAARGLQDRLLHPSRRRAALRALRERARPRSIIFVCYGNIYRSPYAAVLFQSRIPAADQGSYTVTSAGFVGPDRPSPEVAVARAVRDGIDLTPHRSSLLTPARVAEADLILVMDRQQQGWICERYGKPRQDVVILGDLDPHPVSSRTIVDPWKNDPGVLDASYARILRCVDALVDALPRG